MAEGMVSRVEQGPVKIKNVPIAVTPEGFWCCPSPVGFQKGTKVGKPLNNAKPSSPPDKAAMQKKQTSSHEKRPATTPPRSSVLTDDVSAPEANAPVASTPVVHERSLRTRNDHLPRKVSIEFGEPRTSDMKVILVGKQGFCVKLSVHKTVLAEKSSFFAGKIAEENGELPCLQIDDCHDAELYVEVVGLMYCKDMRQRMIKQSVSHVLRILKVAETLGFRQCIRTCLRYLEAVPWVGEEEEEKVISSILRLQSEGVGATPVLKRVYSESSSMAVDTLSHVLDLVIKSTEERGRREMKLVVFKLLMENSSLPSYAGSSDICNQTIYDCCRSCLHSLTSSFKRATDPEFGDRNSDAKEPVVRQIALEADNLSWLLEILSERHVADDFAMMWASQDELANLHEQLPTVSRYRVNCVTARLFVGIGKGQLLPSKETRLLLMKTWLQPLINDYRWLQHGCKSFDRKVVEEGIGRTILTLPLEDQQRILLSWLGSFLKSSDSCPNLQRAFEVWWRRTFARPVEIQPQGQSLHSDLSTVSK